MQESNLPQELRESFHRAMRAHERGILTGEETTNALLGYIRDHVDSFHGDLDDRSRRLQADALTVAAARSTKVTSGFLAEACRLSPPGNDDQLDAVIDPAISNVRSTQEASDAGTFDLLHAWLDGGGTIPTDLVQDLRHAEALSGASWLLYLHASNNGDIGTAERIIERDAHTGCPASLLAHLERTNATEAEVFDALGRLDQRRMFNEERWGDMAAVAVFLAERGWLERAKVWSDLIPNDRILPLMTFADQDHHDVFGVHMACAIANDARVLAPLAFIDFLAGDNSGAERRFERSRELDRDVGHLYGAFVGHRALIGWVRSRLATDARLRMDILEGIDPHDAWLGLLQAQIEGDLADLAEATGDIATATKKRERVARIIANRPDVELYVAHFPYNSLLRRLPVASR